MLVRTFWRPLVAIVLVGTWLALLYRPWEQPLTGEAIHNDEAAVLSVDERELRPLASVFDGPYPEVADVNVGESCLKDLVGIAGIFPGAKRLRFANGYQMCEPLVKVPICRNQIATLAGLEPCKNLQVIDARGNHISDVSEIMGLPNLRQVYLNGNPLSEKAVALQIPALKARGVQVWFDDL